ncbi:MAG: sulfite exporter TauE/SafE family protein [Actinomycetota bacterium]|nr:sulfite exporter TauE/SafE family protein [Actinomycetota bacterium]
MLPVAALIATTAMASGVEGATLFSPLFILALGLAPEVAIGTGLITEVFGFGNGLYAYASRRLIDYRLGGALLVVTIPAAILGTWVSGVVNPDILQDHPQGWAVRRRPELPPIASRGERRGPGRPRPGEQEQGRDMPQDLRRRGDLLHRLQPNGRAIDRRGGGTFIGMVSTGLGELNGYFLLQRCRVPSTRWPSPPASSWSP